VISGGSFAAPLLIAAIVFSSRFGNDHPRMALSI